MPDARCSTRRRRASCERPTGSSASRARMLEDTRARQALDEFFGEWLRFDRVLSAVKDDGRYPAFTPELAAMMVQETRMLLGHLVWNDRNFMEALTADYSFLNAELARLYGLPAPAGRIRDGQVSRSDSHAPAFSARRRSSRRRPARPRRRPRRAASSCASSCSASTCRIRRPASTPTCPSRRRPMPPRAKRQRMVEHAQNPTCSGCHRLMDPIGFGLEKFDAIGAWRDQEIVRHLMPARARSRRSKPVPRRHRPPREKSPGMANSTFGDSPSSWAACWRRAPSARNASSNRCSDTPTGGSKRPADEQTGRPGAAATFRSRGSSSKSLLHFARPCRHNS